MAPACMDTRKIPKQPMPADFFPTIGEMRAQQESEPKVPAPPPQRIRLSGPPPEAAQLSRELLAMEQSYESDMRFRSAANPKKLKNHVDDWSPASEARARLRHGKSTSALLNVQQNAQRDEVQKHIHTLIM